MASRSKLGGLIGLSLWIAVSASACAPTILQLTDMDRAIFRETVKQYQIAVVPLCNPQAVALYTNARKSRDEEFLNSLRDTQLQQDYDQAVAEFHARERLWIRECSYPPPPPGTNPEAIRIAKKRNLEDGFRLADQYFENMVQARDRALERGSSR